MASCNPTRRTMLGSIAAAPIAAGIPALALAAPGADAAAFDRVYAAMLRAEAISDRYERTVEDPTLAAMKAEFDRLPHVEATCQAKEGLVRLSTEDDDIVRMATRHVDAMTKLFRDKGKRPPPHADEGDFMQACRRIVVHDKRRQHARVGIRRAHGWPAITKRGEALVTAYLNAVDAMIATPVGTIRQAAMKMEAILERGEPSEDDMQIVIRTVIGDLHRLADAEGVRS